MLLRALPKALIEVAAVVALFVVGLSAFAAFARGFEHLQKLFLSEERGQALEGLGVGTKEMDQEVGESQILFLAAKRSFH